MADIISINKFRKGGMQQEFTAQVLALNALMQGGDTLVLAVRKTPAQEETLLVSRALLEKNGCAALKPADMIVFSAEQAASERYAKVTTIRLRS